MSMEIKEYQASIEAILFAAGEPISAEKIAEALELHTEEVEKLIRTIADQMREADRGVEIVRMEDKYQICTKAEFGGAVRKALEIHRNTPLSQAAMEILAIIAYNQPVTKSFVEQVRGVDSSGVVSTLCQKGLIEEKGRLEVPGRPLLFGTTDLFLRSFQLNSLDELPEVNQPQTESDTAEEQPVQETLAE